MLRTVVDPGVLIAALLSPHGTPALLLGAWWDGRFDLLVCRRLLAELASVLERPKFRPYVPIPDTRRYVEMLRRSALLLDDPSDVEPLTPDPGDDYLVAFARQAGAHVLVSGDPHLTKLRRPRPPVLTPWQFVDRLERDRSEPPRNSR